MFKIYFLLGQKNNLSISLPFPPETACVTAYPVSCVDTWVTPLTEKLYIYT